MDKALYERYKTYKDKEVIITLPHGIGEITDCQMRWLFPKAKFSYGDNKEIELIDPDKHDAKTDYIE